MPFDDWTLFKKIEKQGPSHRPRTRSKFLDNYTAALALPIDQTLLCENEKNTERMLSLSEKNILEHAARRVDLFFYLLVAYNKSNHAPIQGSTRLQHGIGRRNIHTKEVLTHAAHSSFTTAVLDRTILDTKRLKSAIWPMRGSIKSSILCGTHFMDSLNSTIELPVCINEFDTELELTHGGRDKSFKILREVAEGRLDPIQGLLQFLLMMRDIFIALESSIHSNENKNNISKEVMQTIIALEKKGTLINKLSLDEKSVNANYVYMLLRLSPEEIVACQSSPEKQNDIFNTKMQSIKDEILNTPSEHMAVEERWTPRLKQ